MTLDMSKYLGLFVSEATEHLEALSQDLVQLENGGGRALVDSMFRHAHSVKGMAGSMGFDEIAALAHRVEDLVDKVRADPSLLQRDLVDLLLAASDHMLGQVRACGQNLPPPSAKALVEQLGARLSTIRPAAPEEPTVAGGRPLPAAAPASEPTSPRAEPPVRSEGGLGLPPRFALKVRIAPSCPVPGVRAFLVHRRLSALGNVFDLRPALEDLKAGRIPDGLVCLELESSLGEAKVRASLSNIPEVALEALREVEPTQPAAAAAPIPPAPMPEATRVVGQEPPRTVRVRTELLDYFLDTVGELLLATARIREAAKALPSNARAPLDEGVDQLHALVKDLHDKVMGARMTPLAVIMDRLPRVARDIARRREREVDLVITGAEIELDRAIIDELGDPLLHLLRNCIDHGIESPEERQAAGKGPRGRVLISVRRQRDKVVVELEDDGRGMDAQGLKAAAAARGLITEEAAERMSDREAYLLCCAPGVSTARDVSDISGRGVGMDAVKRVVENVGGTLEIESEPGRGTRFTLRLPLTVAVIQLLLVQVGTELFGLPIGKVLGATEADEATLTRSRQNALLPHALGLLPVHRLSELLSLEAPLREGPRPYVVMEAELGRVALEVDRLVGQEEAVLKPLSKPLDLIPGLAGITILGSGRPVFILDVPRLLVA
jgi:two-component system, chemotaxis family, sensor kinase CheA